MVDNRERECFRRWTWFRVNPRLMRILRQAREDPKEKGYSLIKTTHLKRRFDDSIMHMAACSGLPSEFIPLFFETFSVTWDEMWLIADHLQEDGHCRRDDHKVDYFPNDTLPKLDVHRTNQIKGNRYQVDRFGCRLVSVYIRLVIFDSGYEDVKVINYQASNQFKYHVRVFSYPMIPFNGTTFDQVPKEAAIFL